MIDLGLTVDEFDAYLTTLRSSHTIQVDATLHDQNEKAIGSLTAGGSYVVAGSVQVDGTGDISRSLDMTLVDPKDKLRFEADSPAQGALYADRFISVRYGVLVPDLIAADYGLDLSFWVDCPVFWGPLTRFQRRGHEINIEAQGKETLMLAPHFATHGFALRHGTRLDDAVQKVGRHYGEGRFRLPDLSARLPRHYQVMAAAEGWKVIGSRRPEGLSPHHPKGLVDRMPGKRGAYYDAEGRLTVRRMNRKSAFTFAAGRDLTSVPDLAFTDEFRNCVVVRGGKPKGKPRATARAILPRKHPLSPWSLSRNDEPRFLTEFIDADGLKSDKKCRERAHEELKRFEQSGVEATFECLPIPFLEESDYVRLQTNNYAIPFRLDSFTLPLTTEAMAIGFNKPVKKWKRAKAYHG